MKGANAFHFNIY